MTVIGHATELVGTDVQMTLTTFETCPLPAGRGGMALAIGRFDLRMGGTYRGFEDFSDSK